MVQRQFNLRSIKKPNVKVPIACRSIGHYFVNAGWIDKPKPKKMFVELFWGIKGVGRFVIEGKIVLLKPDYVLVLFSGDKHIIEAESAWEYRWLTLDGELADQVVDSLGLSRSPHFSGTCPETLFDRLTLEIDDITPRGQYIASTTAYEIFTIACKNPTSEDSTSKIIEEAIALMKQNYSDPNFDISALAKELKIHRTSLSRLFRKKLEITPIAYLISLRLQQAMRLLQNTNLPVATISERIGFNYVTYLTNLMKRQTGFSPSQFRNLSK